MDIVTIHSTQSKYFVASRKFELPELKLLIDAVESSKFITKKKSETLIEKIHTMTSPGQVAKLKRNNYVVNRIKPDNEQIYYIIDAINDAINAGKQISFQYYDYTGLKKKVLKNKGEIYKLSPYKLLWNGDNYYVIGYSEKKSKVINFRVDRIASKPEILDKDIVPMPDDFDIENYTKEVFFMFSGEKVLVDLRCDNSLMKTMVDRFGEDVTTLAYDMTSFRVQTEVSASPTFFGWVFGFNGKVQILAPESVKEQYRQMISQADEGMQESEYFENKFQGVMAMENKLEKIGQNSFMDNFVKTDDILKDMCGIIESSQKAAYQAVNTLLVQRNWLIGYRIAEEELGGDERSEYGLEVIKKISKELTQRYGKGYDRSNLYHCLKFYKTFPEIVDTACRQSGVLLSWSHYRTLLQVKDPEARDWYEKEAAEQTWSVRTLQRNISSQYYYRMLGTQKKELVESEMKELTASYQNDKLEFIKNPVVAEFLGFSQNTDFTESDLEKSILSNLQKFLMELGKGYAFVARQQHIHTEKQDYYIDLVFYNYILKCFVLIDLKTEKITHQDVGQMDMYIRMYDELKRSEGDNPTIGIVLCSDTDDDIARYSVMHGNEQLFASKYKLYLPTKEELKAEIETQKAMFYLQQQEREDKEIE